MGQILVTGATGNIGQEVVHYLNGLRSDSNIHAAVRDIQKAKEKFKNYPDLLFRQFDFENDSSFSTAFANIDILFLLRPPHISDIEKVFRPLLTSAKENGINKVVFLSVQGAERSKIIPHHKIESLIKELKFNYIFVRPSYFMQNLTTTLLDEIATKRTITLPSGSAKFNWIDIKNIGEATAHFILNFEKHQNQPYEITGSENKNFEEVSNLLTEITGIDIHYKSINPTSFFFKKKKEGVATGLALVMTILHFLPRFQSEPTISENYHLLTGKNPTTLKEFIKREKRKLIIPHKA